MTSENAALIYFRGMGHMKEYPAWRHHKYFPAIIVQNTDEDLDVLEKGYERMAPHWGSYKGLINWFWDIEDMSPKQLVVYAKEEWGIDLPVEADQEHLQRAIFELIKSSPSSRGRITFMAHEMKMDYDAVQQEIRDLSKNGMSEVEERVIVI